MREIYKYEYFGWQITVYSSGDVRVNLNGHNRVYEVPDIIRIDQDKEYVYLYKGNDNFVQVKFEEGNFLVIDEFNQDGSFFDSIGSWVFDEDEDLVV